MGDGGRFLLYAGEIEQPGSSTTMPGQIELELHPSVELRVHLIGHRAIAADASLDDSGWPRFSLPPDADLTPPDPSAVRDREKTSRAEFHASHIDAGDLERCARLLIHIGGGFEAFAKPRAVEGGGSQGQIDFALPGWDLTLVPGSGAREHLDFAAVIAAVPGASGVTRVEVDRLQRWLFLLLSFIANREVDGITCGEDSGGRIAWADWTNPRIKSGKSAITWCPEMLVPDALPELAEGMSAIAASPDFEVVVDRAIGYSLAANGGEVIEVRIPIVCSGLELLAWAILQREEWLIDGDARRRLGTAANVRLLLKWAGIPTAIPPSLPVLGSHLRASGQPGWEGPEILFNIRNAMVHPPKRLSEPEWPDGDLLIEAWQLGTWYLELALLRVLGYDGQYWSRVRLGRPGSDVEPVPWNMTD
jgi:hypothetical protein